MVVIILFKNRKKQCAPTFDISQKAVKTWWGGTKIVPTTKTEQRKLKADIQKRIPDAVIIDSKAKREIELKWIDRIEEYDAMF